jgi:uncharacterized glyoxalase superfamily protein PhnB
MIKGIKFASVPVRDQQKVLDFFTQKIGFVVATDQPFDDNQRWIELRIPGADTRMVLFTPKGHEKRIGEFVNFTFVTDDVDGTYRELKAKGVEFTAPPQKAQWGSSVQFKDPDGNTYLISSK